MVKSIRLKIIYDDSCNAYAVGRRTICITLGLLSQSDECIMGILAHEVGHNVHRDSEIQMIVGDSNIFILGALFIIKMVCLLITFIFSLIAFRERERVMGVIIFITGCISSLFIALWTKVCMLFLKASMRANEYYADEFAYEVGFGNELCMALDQFMRGSRVDNTFLKILSSTHPLIDERIARLQDMGANYKMSFYFFIQIIRQIYHYFVDIMKVIKVSTLWLFMFYLLNEKK